MFRRLSGGLAESRPLGTGGWEVKTPSARCGWWPAQVEMFVFLTEKREKRETKDSSANSWIGVRSSSLISIS